jgi:hypothetical protein
MSHELDPTIRAMTETVKFLNQIAAHRLIAQSEYPELRLIAETARQRVGELVITIGKLKEGRAPKRADD